MSIYTRILFFITLTLAMSFGFMHFLFPEYNFERLHIFLFNLCAGGSIIIFYTENKGVMTLKNIVFFYTNFYLCLFSFF